MKVKNITQGAMLSSIAAIFQLTPIFFSEMFIILTIFSTVPIYINARKGLKLGMISYIVTAVVVLIFSTHESIMFLFTNGIIGLILGITKIKFDKRYLRVLITATVLTGSLCIVNYVIGILVIGINLSNILLQITLLFIISIVYTTIFSFIVEFFENRMSKFIKINRKR